MTVVVWYTVIVEGMCDWWRVCVTGGGLVHCDGGGYV